MDAIYSFSPSMTKLGDLGEGVGSRGGAEEDGGIGKMGRQCGDRICSVFETKVTFL